MNNRKLWSVVAAGVGLVILVGVMAQWHPRAVETVRSGPGPEVDLPVTTDLGVGRPSAGFVPPRISARRVEDPSGAEPSLPQTQPASRPAASRPVRVAKFADAVADEQLTPQNVARVALSYVGADPVAEQVWVAAINNPNFTANERKDLIEDLNQEGFDDPKNLTAADAPLIVSRIQLIENLAPQAADDVNAAAFAEAYKDLVNMLAKLTKG